MEYYGIQSVCNLCACVAAGWSGEELGRDISKNESAAAFIADWIDSAEYFARCYFCEEMIGCMEYRVWSR